MSDSLQPHELQHTAPHSSTFAWKILWTEEPGGLQFMGSLESDTTEAMQQQQASLSITNQLPEFTQTNVHRVSDAIQPSHPLLFPSPPALNPSQQQSLFQ